MVSEFYVRLCEASKVIGVERGEEGSFFFFSFSFKTTGSYLHCSCHPPPPLSTGTEDQLKTFFAVIFVKFTFSIRSVRN